VGTPAAGHLTPAPGAGHGDEGDASFQGPAQEQNEALPASPEPTNAEAAIVSLPTSRKAKKAEVTVTSIPKPERRKNAKERAKGKIEQKNKAAKDGTTPDTTAKAKSKVAAKAETKARKSKQSKSATA
jgi:hypothetical protein